MIYLGSLKKKASKAGGVYYSGVVGKTPMVGFVSSETGNINLNIDEGMIKWINEQEEKNKPQIPEQGIPAGTPDDTEDLPF